MHTSEYVAHHTQFHSIKHRYWRSAAASTHTLAAVVFAIKVGSDSDVSPLDGLTD